MRFLVDENVPRQIGLFLLDLGHDALIVRDSPLSGANDFVLWELAAKEHRIIITHDLDFPIPGVTTLPEGLVLIRPFNNHPAAILDLFRKFWSAISPDDLSGHIISVQAGRYRRRPLR
ncbi:MAG: DUF5615 family PIN-like protein [Deltaproteobacteria bacterium]|nr:DUF5615 family PIN-like protein [Deltaproteobacteria bacterium]